ncbi:MAG: hypothetical protein O7G85_00105, partial [Planctomycetota bacterium]|nr:hypothetical protein [Planctomycetota bacterium]
DVYMKNGSVSLLVLSNHDPFNASSTCYDADANDYVLIMKIKAISSLSHNVDACNSVCLDEYLGTPWGQFKVQLTTSSTACP